MTKEERRRWNESQSIMKDIKETAMKEKGEYDEEIVCAICDKILGYTKEAFTDALCKECSLE